jgi:hypothetical protein
MRAFRKGRIERAIGERGFQLWRMEPARAPKTAAT